MLNLSKTSVGSKSANNLVMMEITTKRVKCPIKLVKPYFAKQPKTHKKYLFGAHSVRIGRLVFKGRLLGIQ